MQSLDLNIGLGREHKVSNYATYTSHVAITYSIIRKKEDGAIEFVVWVENLSAGEAVPPRLAIAINYSLTVDLYVSEIESVELHSV